MLAWSVEIRAKALGISLLAAVPFLASPAFAASADTTPAHHTSPVTVQTAANPVIHQLASPAMKLAIHIAPGQKTTALIRPVNQTAANTPKETPLKGGKVQYTRTPILQCVTFARAASGIELKGNAVNWWDAASGVYARGQEPEVGSVLNFRANGHMRLGHVAVVTHVVNEREIEIDHANWAGPGASKGGVSRSISVVDVSAKNDWTAVRVGLGHSADFGSIYPTYGFIYDRADTGVMSATNNFGQALLDEVAEAPSRSIQ